jgi:predicted RNase H-like HicB family nuclease
MSKPSKKPRPIDRPFAPELVRKASQLARQYKVVLEQADGEWYGRGLELPGAMGDGKTPQDCLKQTRQAMTAMVAYMLESGERPPLPASEGRRSEQVNVRLTSEEKALLEAGAKASGFQGLSDFIRHAALDRAR